MKLKKCKVCEAPFPPYTSTQQVCTALCGARYAVQLRQKKEAKEWKEEKKVLKEKTKTWSIYYQEALEIFNTYIRLRDADKPCISCGAPAGTYTMSSGHFHPQGTYKGIAMHEDNSHGQCWYNCNKNKHGNLTEYRPRLIERIGLARVEEIDRLRNMEIKPSIPELIELKNFYKQKIKNLPN